MKFIFSLLFTALLIGSKSANSHMLTLSAKPVMVHKQDSAKPVPGITVDFKNFPVYTGQNRISLSIRQLMKQNHAIQAVAGYSRQGRPIEMYYFPNIIATRL